MISLSNIYVQDIYIHYFTFLGRISAFPNVLVYHYNPKSKQYVIGMASNIKAAKTSNFYTKTVFFFFFLKKLLQRLEAIRPTRSLSRDSLLKDHLKQKQYSKTASRSRPSSAKSTSSSVSHFSRSPSESSLMIGDSLSVASSRISSGSRRSAKGRKISRPVWESGW